MTEEMEEAVLNGVSANCYVAIDSYNSMRGTKPHLGIAGGRFGNISRYEQGYIVRQLLVVPFLPYTGPTYKPIEANFYFVGDTFQIDYRSPDQSYTLKYTLVDAKDGISFKNGYGTLSVHQIVDAMIKFTSSARSEISEHFPSRPSGGAPFP